MEDVVLGHVADAGAELLDRLVQVAAVVEHGALVRRREPGERLHERRLAGAARAHDGEEAVLREGEAHPVEDGPRLADQDRQALGLELDPARVLVGLEGAAHQTELVAPDPDDAGLGDRRPLDALAVDERAVVAVQVGDLVTGLPPRP